MIFFKGQLNASQSFEKLSRFTLFQQHENGKINNFYVRNFSATFFDHLPAKNQKIIHDKLNQFSMLYLAFFENATMTISFSIDPNIQCFGFCKFLGNNDTFRQCSTQQLDNLNDTFEATINFDINVDYSDIIFLCECIY